MDRLRLRDVEPERDADGLWAILGPIFRRGDTYAVAPDTTRDEAVAFWLDHARIRVAVDDDRVVGTYYLGPNHGGNGDHVANCGYAVHTAERGRGIGRSLCEDSLDRAREAGYTAMQYNLVVSTNHGAIRLWQAMGFRVVGTVPEGFRHPEFGHVDAHVMHRHL